MANVAKGTLYYHNSYYYIGQVTRFVRPAAQRIISASSLDELETLAFENVDGQIAVVVLNRTDKSFNFALKYNGLAAYAESPAHSISTFRFQPDSAPEPS
jgi:glucosylceramidase